ncbi:GNAT family N-acetyltransferase [Rhizobacter sp. SG703]|uniref:GNAT family N-acetyltransferase n=1 Tax=Rhizobacter sp. SG703 TaxID=2587140 RepID=UPI0017F17BC6|nr:GNAT family N-acetyltransferase [Rhizobacter sp. SG703]NKI93127.1 RimJ/RimL family protein N-acetyltransferase [Rhizobacter sp. SG703]
MTTPPPSPASVTLRTERLLLRPLHDDDAATLLAIFGDPEAMRYWSVPAWTSLDQAHAMLGRDRAERAAGTHLRLGLERRDDGALIGVCTLFNLSATCRRAEVGYALARAAWGQGHMNEALRALLRHPADERVRKRPPLTRHRPYAGFVNRRSRWPRSASKSRSTSPPGSCGMRCAMSARCTPGWSPASSPIAGWKTVPAS